MHSAIFPVRCSHRHDVPPSIGETDETLVSPQLEVNLEVKVRVSVPLVDAPAFLDDLSNFGFTLGDCFIVRHWLQLDAFAGSFFLLL